MPVTISGFTTGILLTDRYADLTNPRSLLMPMAAMVPMTVETTAETTAITTE